MSDPERESESDEKPSAENLGMTARSEPNLRPSISAYYKDSGTKPVLFLKAVRTAKMESFRLDDVTGARIALRDADPLLTRSISLLNKRQPAIEKWLHEATKTALELYALPAVTNLTIPTEDLFGRIVQECATDLVGRDKKKKVRAQNLVRLALAWLVETRNLSSFDALRSLQNSLKSSGKAKTPATNARSISRLLLNAKFSQLRGLAVAVALTQDVVDKAIAERTDALNELGKVVRKRENLERELQEARDGLEACEEGYKELRKGKLALHTEMQNMKELHEHEFKQRAARLTTNLKEHVRQHLTDAHDALGFDPPSIEGAKERIDIAIQGINRIIEGGK